MKTIAEVRSQFPQYSDLSDEQLAGALHQKYYSDMPFADFSAKIGLKGGGEPAKPTTAQKIAAHPATRFAVGAASPFLGVAQALAENPVSKYVWGGNPVTEKLQTLAEMQKAGGHEGVDLAGLLGSVGSPAALATKVPVATSMLGKIAQGAGLGAAAGVTQPTLDQDFWQTKGHQAIAGGAVGAAIPAVMAPVAKGLAAARNIADPWLPGGADRVAARIANATAGDRRPEVLAALKANQQLVPGSQAVAGEVAAPAGSAEFAGLQKLVSTLRPSEYVAQGKAQDAARVGAVRSVGQDKAALDAAEATRAANALANYEQAYQQAVKADPKLAMIVKNPYVKDALPDALKLAEANGVNPKTDMTQFLHYVKLSLDKAVGKTGDTALSHTERRSVETARERLIDWISQKNPAYDAARQQFAKESAPINQMQVGQYLENKLVAPVDTAKQRASMYASAVREAPTTLKRATGFNRHEDIADVLTPQQVQAVTGVSKDLSRHAEYEQLASAGTKKAQDIISETLPAAPAAGMFNPKYSVARAIVNRLTGNASSKALDRLAVQMQDPQKMAQLMDSLNPVQRKMVIEELMKAASAGAGAAIAQ